jgi:two-component system competent response regulator ComA
METEAPIELSEKERQLLHLVYEEKTNTAIAQTLDISEKTVERYLSQLYNRLEVQTRVGAAVWYSENIKT